jgi:hypothetical protein
MLAIDNTRVTLQTYFLLQVYVSEPDHLQV